MGQVGEKPDGDARKTKMRQDLTMAVLLQVLLLILVTNAETVKDDGEPELHKEHRKIAKLLLKESGSYHNLVEEEEEEGQKKADEDPIGYYAPQYPYSSKALAKNRKIVKAQLRKANPDLSRFTYTLSSVLLPPPREVVPTEENAELYYAPYMNTMEDQFDSVEEDVDVYYLPYMNLGRVQPVFKKPKTKSIEDYYSAYQFTDKLPQHSAQDLYQGPVSMIDNEILDSPIEEVKLFY